MWYQTGEQKPLRPRRCPKPQPIMAYSFFGGKNAMEETERMLRFWRSRERYLLLF
jgi:hypothetical protein